MNVSPLAAHCATAASPIPSGSRLRKDDRQATAMAEAQGADFAARIAQLQPFSDPAPGEMARSGNEESSSSPRAAATRPTIIDPDGTRSTASVPPSTMPDDTSRSGGRASRHALVPPEEDIVENGLPANLAVPVLAFANIAAGSLSPLSVPAASIIDTPTVISVAEIGIGSAANAVGVAADAPPDHIAAALQSVPLGHIATTSAAAASPAPSIDALAAEFTGQVVRFETAGNRWIGNASIAFRSSVWNGASVNIQGNTKALDIVISHPATDAGRQAIGFASFIFFSQHEKQLETALTRKLGRHVTVQFERDAKEITSIESTHADAGGDGMEDSVAQ